LEVGKGLCPVANSDTLILVFLFINSFCIDQRNQPSDTEFIITSNQCVTWGLIPLIYAKRVYEQRNKYKAIWICNGTQTLAYFQEQKGFIKG
jgi:hypothetical protein